MPERSRSLSEPVELYEPTAIAPGRRSGEVLKRVDVVAALGMVIAGVTGDRDEGGLMKVLLLAVG
jgi:hypothetical protein